MKVLTRRELTSLATTFGMATRGVLPAPPPLTLTGQFGFTCYQWQSDLDIRGSFPYRLQRDLLIDSGWDGWWQLEANGKVPDRLEATIEQHRFWDDMVTKSVSREA